MRRPLLAAAILLLSAPSSAHAQSVFERLWRHAELYRNDDNPTVQSVRFGGRFQYDNASVDDNETYTEGNVRRMRLGLRAGLFGQLTAAVEGDFNPQERDPFYKRLTTAYVEWSERDALAITVGKHSAPFTMDGATSSSSLLTIDRNNLTNNIWFTDEYMPGVSASGTSSNWAYHGGVYSSGAESREFGDFSGSAFVLGSLGYDFHEALDVEEALLSANIVLQGEDPNNDFTRDLGQLGSLNFKLEGHGWGVRTDLAAGRGYMDQPDIWGTMVMPYVSIVPAVQLVTRYTYVSSDGDNGVRLPRYENRHTGGRGDRYSEVYLGLNYYVYQHRLKLQSGMKLATMADAARDGGGYSGASFTTAFRISW